MGIEGTHAYRFVYLKSEEWATVRAEALAREEGKCQVCGYANHSNDAHHIWYPENFYLTKESHLAVLCRPCHDFLHAVMPECKTSNEFEGRAMWEKFRSAARGWRRSKLHFFGTSDGVVVHDPKTLRLHIKELEEQIAYLESKSKKRRIYADQDSIKLLVSIRREIDKHLAKKLVTIK